MVAVWTRLAPRSPHGSRRALLTHRALPSGSGVEALTRQRVQYPDWRKEACDEPDKLLPSEKCLLAPPPERTEPSLLQLVEEPPQARVINHPVCSLVTRCLTSGPTALTRFYIPM